MPLKGTRFRGGNLVRFITDRAGSPRAALQPWGWATVCSSAVQGQRFPPDLESGVSEPVRQDGGEVSVSLWDQWPLQSSHL